MAKQVKYYYNFGDGIMANLLENDIKISCKALDLWHRRLRDMVRFKGSGSPFDYVVFDGVTLVGIEAKLLRQRKSGKPKSFPFSRVSDTQREGLKDLEKYDNTKACILVNFRWLKKKGRCFALSIGEFLELEDELDRKSIPLDYFKENVKELPRHGKGWNIKKLMGSGN